MAERVLLFSVIAEGKTYNIFTNGEIEGFGDDAIIVNYFDLLVARAIHERDHRQQQGSQSLEVGQSTA